MIFFYLNTNTNIYFLPATLCSPVGKANVASLPITAYLPSAAAVSQVKINPFTPISILKTVNKLQVRNNS